MFYQFSQEELRALCRTHIETLEMWARRFIHETLVQNYGKNYFDYKNSNGDPLINKEIRNNVLKLGEKHPQIKQRPVDGMYFEDLIKILCNPKLYKHFKSALDYMYPQGNGEVRCFLSRLIPTRNALSHANPISIRQAEQVVCYTNDFIDGLKSYYKDVGMDKVWNVPKIIRATDSFGNVFVLPVEEKTPLNVFTVTQPMYCGDTYSVQVDIDPSFDTEEYEIYWLRKELELKEYRNKTKLSIQFEIQDVTMLYTVTCCVASKREWHKFGQFDSELMLHLQVRPPIN